MSDVIDAPIPVTLLTGFLGSGKTTLLNYLLRTNNGEPIAIVENEFGAVGIDGQLLKTEGSVSVVELSNGCVCCSVRGEFTEALHTLLAQRDKGELSFRRLIIETTGLADPAPVIQTFFVDELIRETMKLDAVITLADCEHIQQQLDEHRVAASQLGFADRILLTKADRVSEETKKQVLSRLLAINNKADIYEVVQGVCPASLWLDINAFDLDDNLSVNKTFKIISPFAPETQSISVIQNSVQQHSWSDDIQSYLFEGAELDLKKIGSFMENTIEKYGNDMLRYKGVLAIDGQPQKLIVQGVHKVVGFDYGAPWDTDTPKVSRLIIIGRYLPFDELTRLFADTHV